MRLRVLTWNVCYMRRAEAKVALLRAAMDEVPADTVVVAALLEVTPNDRPSFEALFSNAGYSLDLRPPGRLDARNRQLGVMIGCRGARLEGLDVVQRAPYPDRTLAAEVVMKEQRAFFLAAHALTGVGYRRAKMDQFRAVAEFLGAAKPGVPRLMAIDANEPNLDALELRETVFWDEDDKGRGAALLLGSDASHGLTDALRRRLEVRSDDFRPHSREALVASFFTKKRACRFDQCWVSKEWRVDAVEYRYQQAVEAGSDHALLVVDLALGEPSRLPDPRPVQGDGTPALDAVRSILIRAPIPPGQLALYKALLTAPPDGLTYSDVAKRMRDGDERSLNGVLGALGKRVNQTTGFTETRPGTRYLIQEVEGRYRALPLLIAAIKSLPDLRAKLDDSYEAIYEVGEDQRRWFRVTQAMERGDRNEGRGLSNETE